MSMILHSCVSEVDALVSQVIASENNLLILGGSNGKMAEYIDLHIIEWILQQDMRCWSSFTGTYAKKFQKAHGENQALRNGVQALLRQEY